MSTNLIECSRHGASGVTKGYEIDNSLRFNDDDSSGLTRTVSSAGNRKTWTYSCWVKRSSFGTWQRLLATTNNSGTDTDATYFEWGFWNTGELYLGAVSVTLRKTTAVYRDPSAWYHIVLHFDTTQSTASNRIKIYINNEEVTDFSTNTAPSQDSEWGVSNAIYHAIGATVNSSGSLSGEFLDGHLAEVNFIDGQALTPSDFGESGDYGEWKPKAYTGTYGNNGFYLDFSGNDAFLAQGGGGQFTVNSSNQITRTQGNDSCSYFSGADLTGDFEFSWTYGTTSLTPGDGYRIGVFSKSEVSTVNFNSGLPTSTNFGLTFGNTGMYAQNNTDGTIAISGGSTSSNVWKMTRTSGTFKIYKDGSLKHTFTTTNSNDMLFFFGSGDKDETIVLNNLTFIDVDGAGTTATLTGNNTLGGDQSANNNHWTPNNLASTDQMLDTPTNNFCTMNPLHRNATVYLGGTGQGTFSEGNLKVVGVSASGGAGYYHTKATLASTSKQYAEFYMLSAAGQQIGVSTKEYSGGNYGDSASTGAAVIHSNGDCYVNGSVVVSYSSYVDTDIISLAYSPTVDKIWFSKNGVWQGTGTPDPSTNTGGVDVSGVGYNLIIIIGDGQATNATEVVANFGQDSSFAGTKTAQGNQDGNGIGDFYYTPPTGFLALCTKNLPDPTVIPSEHFNTVLYTGNSSSGHNVTGVGFQPDFTWLKHRNNPTAHQHNLFDIVRGVTKTLHSNSTEAEEALSNMLSSFDSDGFTVNTDNAVNQSPYNYVAWNWKAGGTAVSNTNGTITSSVSANVDAGFSIVSYTGQSGASTVGHGLSKAPEMIIVKNRDSIQEWVVMVEHCGNADFETDYLRLDTNGNLGDNTFFNDTKPTNSLFSVGDSQPTNSGHGNDYISYCFHSVDGFSKMGFYVGNSSTDGVFNYCGFAPRYIMIKKINANNNWYIYDTARTPYNATGTVLLADSTNAEATQTYFHIDILSNGFKARTTDGAMNSSSGQYTWISFAEMPFKHSNAR